QQPLPSCCATCCTITPSPCKGCRPLRHTPAPVQGWRAPPRRPEISFNHGAEWKALISRYIGTIPLSGEAGAAEQSMSGGPPTTPVSSAMPAKVGAAARLSHPAAPNLAAFRRIGPPKDPPELARLMLSRQLR